MRSFLRHWWACAVAIVLLSSAIHAQDHPQLHYRLRVRIEPATHKLDAEAVIRNPASARFYLYKGLAVREVTSAGKPVAYRADSSAPRVPYAPSAEAYSVDAADTKELTIKYGGEITENIAGVNMITPDLTELALYSAWYPMFSPLKQFTFDMEVELPAGFVVTTNAKAAGSRGRSITQWTSFGACPDIVLIASPKLRRMGNPAQGTRVAMFYSDMPEQMLKTKLDGMAWAMDRLSAWYGPPRIQGTLRFVYSPRAGWGYSRIPLFVVSEQRALETLKVDNGEARDFRANVHEIAHFWWAVANPDTPDDWINEGLAEYSAYRLSEQRFGEAFTKMRLAEYRQNATQNKTTAAIAETEMSSPDREINRYDKATLMFLEARRRFGEAALDKVLRALHAQYAGNVNATTALFLDEAERQIGKQARDFFYDELYRKSTPAAEKTAVAK